MPPILLQHLNQILYKIYKNITLSNQNNNKIMYKKNRIDN